MVVEPMEAPSGTSWLIDDCLPQYDFSITHARIYPASPDACYEAALRIDLLRDPVVRTLLTLRALPHRLLGGRAMGREVPTRTFGLSDMIGPPLNWALLGEKPGEELTVGQISRPWKSAELPRTPPATPVAFAAFHEPGYAKIVFALHVMPYGHGASVVTMETRLALTDAASLKRFARYWRVVGPFSDLIRRIALRQLDRELDLPSPGSEARRDHQPPPRGERIRMRIEHEVDTRSIHLAAWLLRRTDGRLARLWHRRVLLLTTTGRRSGRRRTVPLQYFPDGNDMIVVAANSGLPSPPGWYFNLTTRPGAIVELDGRTLSVRAEQLTPEQAATFWPRVLGIAPDYARYLKRTSRLLPLVRLVPDPAAVSDR